MDQKYKINSCWSKHGDIKTDKSAEDPKVELDVYDLIRTAFIDGDSQPTSYFGDQADVVDGGSEESEFRKKLDDAETPLYSNCPNYTKVSAIMGLYRLKVKSGMSENYFDQLLTMIHDMLPTDNVLPQSTYGIKKFLKMFGFGYDMIHACKNDCVLYRKEYEAMESCPRCSVSRWERDKQTGEEKKGIPAKVLRYFPIKDRLRRLFRSRRTAEEVRWHFNNKSLDGTMRHPMDSLTWANVTDKWPEFSAEPRNLRLGISTDGMNLFCLQCSTYSTWPVFLVNYNMHPTLCMKAENIMLSLLIPGSTSPGNNIDVYLAPLIDDLKELWNEGLVVYDSFMKENFTIKAMLLWSITDYPALGTLAGCKVKGKQACVVCGKDTPFRWLKFIRNHVYLGNKKRLRPGHPYRRRKKWFDNTVEEGSASRIESGAEIFNILKDLKVEFGKPFGEKSKKKRKGVSVDEVPLDEKDDEDNDNWRWKKLSILFELPYWKASHDKIIIFDWNAEDVVVAEGRLWSMDPQEKANNICLGPNAAIVKVEKVVKHDAYLWRPTDDMVLMGDALYAFIAWPIKKILLTSIIHPTRSSSPIATSPGTVSCSINTTKSDGKKKCMLLDCPNASKVWIEVSKIGDAKVWRPNSEVELVSDALGTTVAWPNDKLVFV
ncbi:PREDICTED: uncharacterized protein LOC104715439 [Camelina sativa]|uniref:Uncharacterized protein LOC104715439 n=1 Tax=Camelina sativa TaxID=90675 RepID=A0ABM0TTJ3_CAMSA|nr:PREDICTED: uncharacterized protein LOC104715439 [Camelina sativa]